MTPPGSLTVAVAQVAPSPGDMSANLDRAVTLVHEAARQGARLLL
ncbi:hypothetical protein [Deinococcus pimensis]|nr:hypothetical protein [Deinococcus pimensis]